MNDCPKNIGKPNEVMPHIDGHISLINAWALKSSVIRPTVFSPSVESCTHVSNYEKQCLYIAIYINQVPQTNSTIKSFYDIKRKNPTTKSIMKILSTKSNGENPFTESNGRCSSTKWARYLNRRMEKADHVHKCI